MSIADLLEEVDLLLFRKQRGPKAVDGRVPPPFVVKAALLVEILEVLGVRFASPKVEVADLKVAPDCGRSDEDKNRRYAATYSGRDCTTFLRHRR